MNHSAHVCPRLRPTLPRLGCRRRSPRTAGALFAPGLLAVLVCLGPPAPAQESVPETYVLDDPAPVVDGRFGYSTATDGVYVAVTRAGAADVFDAATGALLGALVPETPGGFDGAFLSVAVDGGRVVLGSASVGPDGRAWLFDAATGDQIAAVDAPVPGLGNRTFGDAVAIAGELFAVAEEEYDSDDGAVHLYSATTGALLGTTQGMGSPGGTFGDRIAMSDDVLAVARYLSGSGTWVIELFELPSLMPVGTYGDFPQGVDGLDVGGGLIAAGLQSSSEVRLYQIVGGALWLTLPRPAGISGAYGRTVALDADAGLVLVGAPSGFDPPSASPAVVFDMASGDELFRLLTSDDDAGDSFALALDMAGGQAVIGARDHSTAAGAPSVGRAYQYRLVQPKLRVLAIGIDDAGPVLPLRGDLSAQLVGGALGTAFDLPDEDLEIVTLKYDADVEFDGLDNRGVIEERVAAWRERVQPGDTFVFYLGTHGAFDPEGFEVPVCAQASLITFDCLETTGNELLNLGFDATNIQDDEVHALFDHPDWDQVDKLFVIDACMSGGFWGTSADGDTGDLATLPRSALIASAPETKFSYSFPPTGITYLAYALSSVLVDLGDALEAGLFDAITFSDLAEALIEEEGAMLDSFSAESGDFEGVLTGSGPFDLTPFHGQVVPAELSFFVASTPDFAFAAGGGVLAAPRTIRVPKDVADLQQAVHMANPGDTIVAKGLTVPGPLVIEGKQGLTLVAKGVRLQGRGLVVEGSSGVHVRGLRVEHVDGIGIAVGGSSDVHLERCRVTDANAHGVEVLGSEAVTLDRLRVQGVGGDGIVLGRLSASVLEQFPGSDEAVSGSVVMRCRVSGAGGDGLVVGGDGNTVSRCKVVDVDGVGLGVPHAGSQCLFERNLVSGTGANGLVLAGVGQVADRNRVAKAGGHGLVLAGDGAHDVERVALTASGGNGVDVSSPGSTLANCRAKGSAGHGFALHGGGTGNALIGNQAAANALGPLADTAGGNSYEGNSFDGP